jgi:Dolichyl-phosphate-mannose-protein mannosyltransferase
MNSSIQKLKWKYLLSRTQSQLLVIVLFFALLLNASTLGLSDDEAYYWVLAQKPDLGYAYHPPMVAWIIAFFQFILGSIVKSNSPGLVRLPAILCTTCIFFLSLKWISETGDPHKDKLNPDLTTSIIILSFFSLFFLLGWMMLPDLPLLLGWMLTFFSTWRICFRRGHFQEYFCITAGTILLVLSKFSGIFAVFSAIACVFIWTERKTFLKSLVYFMAGLFFSAIPIIIWNYHHNWGAILYQFQDRHSGAHLSLVRYLKFFIVQVVITGPILFFELIRLLTHQIKGLKELVTSYISANSPTRTSNSSVFEKNISDFISIWILPAFIIFFFQPIFSEFKIHWSLVVWWPTLLGFAAWNHHKSQQQGSKRQIIHVAYGVFLGAFIVASCHYPILGMLGAWTQGRPIDPRMDITNDFYSWPELQQKMKEQLQEEDQRLAVVGSRYQTAAQAAFALQKSSPVTLLPRDLKSRDEWPSLNISTSEGPSWPQLNQAVLYVTDQRYSQEPQFENALCWKLKHFEFQRQGYAAKWINLWKCTPRQ